jgi:itaconate CoA-transferase
MSLVTDPQMDTEFAVTDYGVANLKGRPTMERTLSLTNVGHPKSTNELTSDVCRAVLD